MALALACASIFGGKTQAMKEPQSRQNVVAVGRATDKNSNKRFANRAKDHKWQLAVGIGVPVAAASILAFLGVKYWGKKDNDGEPNKKPNINNPDVNNEIQQIEDNANDEENNPEKDPIKVLKVDINQAQVNPKKGTIQVQNPINANPISVPVPVAKVEPKEESIIEKNIAKIKRDSNEDIANETFELFFNKVKIILDNKDKLVASMVRRFYSRFYEDVFHELLIKGKGNYDPKKYGGFISNESAQKVIKSIVDGIKSLYNKEKSWFQFTKNISFYVLSFFCDGELISISISSDGKTLWLEIYDFRIEFDIESLNIGKF